MALVKQASNNEAGAFVNANTVALSSAATAGRLLVSGVAGDKDTGSVPDPGPDWTLVAGDNDGSVSIGLAVRVADGTAADDCPWTWTTPRPSSAWIAEADDFDGLVSLDDLEIGHDPAPTGGGVVTSVDLGPVVAGGDGMAVVHIAIDSGPNFANPECSGGFVELMDAGGPGPDFDPGMYVHVKDVAADESVSTTATRTSGGGDQVSAILLVVVGQAAAPDPAPATSITSGPDDPTGATTADFTLSADEHGCTFEVRLDGGSWGPASGTPASAAGVTTCAHQVTGLSVGEHTLEARATDASANTDATPAEYGWTVKADEPQPIVLAGRVVAEPVDDRLFVELRQADGARSRWAGDEPDASGIPQGMKLSDSAPGGFRELALTLLRDPRRTWPDLNLVDDIVVYGRTSPLGRNAFEGVADHFPANLGDDMQIGVNAAGSQVLLSEDETWRELYVHRGSEGWEEAPLFRKIELANAHFDQAKIGASAADGGLVWDVPNEALSNGPLTELWWMAPAGIRIAKLGYRGVRSGGTGDLAGFEAPIVWGRNPASGFSAGDTLTLDNSSRIEELSQATQWLMLRFYSTGSPAYGGRQQRYDQIALYGDHDLPLVGGSGTELHGLYAHDMLGHMLSTGAPSVRYTIGPSGSIVPNYSFAVPHAAFLTPGPVSQAILEINAYFLNNYGIFENREFEWHPWDPADPRRPTWRARIEGGAHWAPAGREAFGLVNGVVVVYTDSTGRERMAGPPGSACDVESPLLAVDDPSNPYTRRGRRRWTKIAIDWPVAFDSAAIRIGHVSLLEQRLPRRSGTLVVRPLGAGHVPQLEHPTMGPVPVWAARSGDHMELVGWPDQEPFRIIEKYYDPDTKTGTFQLDTSSSRLSAILERVGVRVQGLI